MSTHVVVAPAVQLVVGARAYFLEKDAIVPEGVEPEDIERLVTDGLIAEYVEPEPVEETPPAGVFTQEDVDAAVKAAEDAKDVELAEARKLVEAKAAEVAGQIAELEKAKAAQAEPEKKPAPTSKTSAAKQ